MFTIRVEIESGEVVDVRHGATQRDYAEQRDLARGYSSGIDRPGIVRGNIETAIGPREPRAILLVDERGTVLHRFVDRVDTAGAETLYRHPDGLVWFAGGN